MPHDWPKPQCVAWRRLHFRGLSTAAGERVVTNLHSRYSPHPLFSHVLRQTAALCNSVSRKTRARADRSETPFSLGGIATSTLPGFSLTHLLR